MAMRITFTTDDGRSGEARVPYEGCQYVVVDSMHCECAPREPLFVAGIKDGLREKSDRHIVSKAGCARCKGGCGDLRVDFDTIFGLEEDDRVLNGRPRVY